MLRCKSFLISLLATFLIFGLSPTALAEPGSQIAGTYWMEVAPDGFPSLPGMLSLSDDGLVFAAQYMTPFTNNGRGNWEKVASRGVKGRFLEFGYFPDGSPGHILEVTFEGELDQAFATGELSFVINVYTADQNPLEEDPFFQNTGFMYLTRVPAD